MIMRAGFALSIPLMCLATASCIYGDPGTMVHPERGSNVSHLMFHAFVYPDSLRPNRDLSGITVRACRAADRVEGRVFWAVERGKRGARIEDRLIEYGAEPAKWIVRQPAVVLTPGCYEVWTQGGGIGATTIFWLSPDGAIDSARN